MNLSNQAQQILNALRSNAERQTQYPNGDVWASVYLDNARPDNISASQFAGYLSTLEKAGLYKTVDGSFFGEVKL